MVTADVYCTWPLLMAAAADGLGLGRDKTSHGNAEMQDAVKERRTARPTKRARGLARRRRS